MEIEINEFGQKLGAKVLNWKEPNFPPKFILEGKYCRLEPLNENHSEELYNENQSDTNFLNWTYLSYGPFFNFTDYNNWILEVSQKLDPSFYTILDKNTNKALGVISYLRIDPEKSSIEVGHLNFSNQLKKTRIATEAIYLLMKNVFELGYRRLEWKCNSLNDASKIAAVRFGFQFEGIFRKHIIHKGRSRDTAWFSIIDTEWVELKKVYETWLDENNFDENKIQKISLSKLINSSKL